MKIENTVNNNQQNISRPFFASFRTLYRLFFPMLKTPVVDAEHERLALKYVPVNNLTSKFTEALIYLQKHSKFEIGDYFEFGVYNGTSMSCMSSVVKTLGLTEMNFIGFDSFQGLPAGVELIDNGVWTEGLFSCPKDYTIMNLISNDVDMSHVQFVEGWYDEVLSLNPIKLNTKRVSTVMIDCDTYSSTVLALNFIFPFLSDVSAIFFDDWRLNDLDLKGMGEYQAFNEFYIKHQHEISIVDFGKYNKKSRIFIIKRIDKDNYFTNIFYKKILSKLILRW